MRINKIPVSRYSRKDLKNSNLVSYNLRNINQYSFSYISEKLYRKGLEYELGIKTKKCKIQAHKFFNLAYSYGYEIARESRNAIASLMTKKEISEALKEARLFEIKSVL